MGEKRTYESRMRLKNRESWELMDEFEKEQDKFVSRCLKKATYHNKELNKAEMKWLEDEMQKSLDIEESLIKASR